MYFISKACFFILFSFFTSYLFSQKPTIVAEASIGKFIPIYPNFPEHGLRKDLGLSIMYSTQNTAWGHHFNHPEVGLSARIIDLGNTYLYGYQFSLYPTINFPLTKSKYPVFLKFGLGAAAFTKEYDSIANPDNKTNGSLIAWHFNLSASKSLWVKGQNELRISGGFFHASNSHIQIPNYGVNAFTLGAEYHFNRIQKDSILKAKTSPNSRPTSYWVLGTRYGLGVHELAATTMPTNTPKYGISALGFSAGYVWRNHIKFKTELITKYYNSYYHYLTNQGRDPDYRDASSVSLLIGAELLLGHIAPEFEIGVNIYKPFFDEFYHTFENRSQSDYQLKSIFATRFGMNYYLFNLYSQHKINFHIGAHVNANFLQADFGEASLGMMYRM